jgi:hypothetical protein
LGDHQFFKSLLLFFFKQPPSTITALTDAARSAHQTQVYYRNSDTGRGNLQELLLAVEREFHTTWRCQTLPVCPVAAAEEQHIAGTFTDKYQHK